MQDLRLRDASSSQASVVVRPDLVWIIGHELSSANGRVQRADARESALPKRLIRPLRCNPLLFSIIDQA